MLFEILKLVQVNQELSFPYCSQGCLRDYVDIYTSSDSSGDHIGHLCGSYSKYILSTYSTTGSYYIHYHTDGANTGFDASYIQGFSLDFEATGMSNKYHIMKP